MKCWIVAEIKALFSTLKHACMDSQQEKLFSVVPTTTARGSGHKLELRRLLLINRFHFCVV